MNSAVQESTKIVLGTIILSIVYGISHDLITANVDVRYFTEFHPHIIDSQSPIAMALLWGVIATWWMGAIIGAILSLATQAGQHPRVPAKQVLWQLTLGSVGVFVVAMFTLVMGLTFIQRPIEIPGKTLGPTLGAILLTHNVSYFLSAIVAASIGLSLYLKRPRLDSNLAPEY